MDFIPLYSLKSLLGLPIFIEFSIFFLKMGGSNLDAHSQDIADGYKKKIRNTKKKKNRNMNKKNTTKPPSKKTSMPELQKGEDILDLIKKNNKGKK